MSRSRDVFLLLRQIDAQQEELRIQHEALVLAYEELRKAHDELVAIPARRMEAAQ